EYPARIEGIRRDCAALETTDSVPVVFTDPAVIASAQDTCGCAVLLGSAHPVWKVSIDGDVVKLPVGRDVPRCPCHTVVDTYGWPLIGSHQHQARIGRIDPEVSIVVSAGRAL